MASIEWLFLLAAIFSVGCGGKILPDIRLPKSIIPEHYQIGLIPDIYHSHNSMEGFVHLDFFVQSSTDRIVLHAVNLTLQKDSVVVVPRMLKAMEMMKENDVSKSDENEKPKQPEVLHPISYDAQKEFVIIHLASNLEENQRYRLKFNYSGTLSKNLKGFYRSDYLELKSNTKK